MPLALATPLRQLTGRKTVVVSCSIQSAPSTALISHHHVASHPRPALFQHHQQLSNSNKRVFSLQKSSVRAPSVAVQGLRSALRGLMSTGPVTVKEVEEARDSWIAAVKKGSVDDTVALYDPDVGKLLGTVDLDGKQAQARFSSSSLPRHRLWISIADKREFFFRFSSLFPPLLHSFVQMFAQERTRSGSTLLVSCKRVTTLWFRTSLQPSPRGTSSSLDQALLRTAATTDSTSRRTERERWPTQSSLTSTSVEETASSRSCCTTLDSHLQAPLQSERVSRALACGLTNSS